MHITKTIAAAGCLAFSAGAASAVGVTVGGVTYEENVVFDGLSTDVFGSSGQTFRLGGALVGWEANVVGRFRNETGDDRTAEFLTDYFNFAFDPPNTTPSQISRENLSDATNGIELSYENPRFPDADGIFFRFLPNTFEGENILVNFAVQFSIWDPVSAFGALDLAVFNGESVDIEEDTIRHSNGKFKFVPPESGESNFLTAIEGDGTDTMVFRENSGILGNGRWTAVTAVNDGDIIEWTYDYLNATEVNTDTGRFNRGANMIAFAASTQPASPIPLPAGAVLMLTALAGLGAMARRRTSRAA